MRIDRNVSLKGLNTFGVEVYAAEFCAFASENELVACLETTDREPWILGGGSNVLFVDNIDKFVLQNRIAGIEIIHSDSDSVTVRAGAGVIWHDLVSWAVERDFGGIENLALIPGRAGAAPIQNIGAYGTELQDVFLSLEAIRLEDGHKMLFDKNTCAFGYRESIFKHTCKDRYCITHLTLQLRKPPHTLRTEYGTIHETLDAMGVQAPTIRDVYNAVIAIRSSKLPDPEQFGNAGSFFKNPVVDHDSCEILRRQYPDMPCFSAGENQYKIPAGWLIEQCGWKGKRVGNVSCFEKQALVIVNHGGASGREIFDHAMRVKASVMDRFGVELIPEVNVIGVPT